MVARGLLDTLRAVEEAEEEDAVAVLNAMVRLSEDSGKVLWLGSTQHHGATVRGLR